MHVSPNVIHDCTVVGMMPADVYGVSRLPDGEGIYGGFSIYYTNTHADNGTPSRHVCM